MKYEERLSMSRGRDYYRDPETGRYYTKVDGKWTTVTDNYYLEPDCSVADHIDIIVMEAAKEYHGGDQVWSKVHGKNVHLLLAHREGGDNSKVTYYMTTEGYRLEPDEVEDKH